MSEVNGHGQITGIDTTAFRFTKMTLYAAMPWALTRCDTD